MKWRRGRDSNPRDPCEPSGFQDRRIRPLCHPSACTPRYRYDVNDATRRRTFYRDDAMRSNPVCPLLFMLSLDGAKAACYISVRSNTTETTQKEVRMRNIFGTTRMSALVAIIAAVVMGVSCQQSPTGGASTPTPTPAGAQNGRFQLVVAQQGDRGMVVFMVDTRDGATWFFQPPQGALINGFWSNIPRLTFGDQYWEQVMRQMLSPAQQPGVAGATGPASATSTGRTTTATTPPR